MFEENVRKFEARLILEATLNKRWIISTQKLNMGTGRNKLSNKHWERTFQKDYTLCHTISTVYTKLEKHTYGQMAFNTKPAQLLDPLLREIFREPRSLDLL